MIQRRSFIKGMGASAMALYSHDLVADLIATSPKGQVRQSRFKGMADIVLVEARRLGCTYADVRFTMNTNLPGGSASFTTAGAGRGGGGGGRGFGGGGGRGGGGGGGRGGIIPTDADRQAGGLGVRVVHSGVWGFASSPRRVCRTMSSIESSEPACTRLMPTVAG